MFYFPQITNLLMLFLVSVQVFYEEELDVPLVLFDEVLDHVLRIDRIFRQPQGHLLLIGVSGAGKTTLSRFVAWMNGLTVYQIKVHNKYTAADFDEDLRTVLRRSGCKVSVKEFIPCLSYLNRIHSVSEEQVYRIYVVFSFLVECVLLRSLIVSATYKIEKDGHVYLT